MISTDDCEGPASSESLANADDLGESISVADGLKYADTFLTLFSSLCSVSSFVFYVSGINKLS